MSLAIVYSRGREGVIAPLVTVEVHLSNGLPSLSIVGLPEMAVRESKDRVRGALLNSHFEFPSRRITINLAPADLPKEGGRFDLAIALGILAASGQIDKNTLHDYECVGELSLGGALRPVTGILPVAIQARDSGRKLIVSSENSQEAVLASDATILAAEHLLQVCAHLNGLDVIQPAHPVPSERANGWTADLADVQGQPYVKRALEIAAAGQHNLLMYGPPGTGKSMLAERMPSILPSLTEQQALESAAIMSISDIKLDIAGWLTPPFRAPHHTASGVALVGGGSNPKPGEISLAHQGVLFLDELPEFDRKVLEVLREPLETGTITISRASCQAEFPARFQLLAAMNPCPCGYLGDPSGRCHCTPDQIQRYRSRISGPLLDRIDMHVEVPRVAHAALRKGSSEDEEKSETVQKRVEIARKRAVERNGYSNALLKPAEIKTYCALSEQGHQLLEKAINQLGLSHRAYHRILKVARTIADLSFAEDIQVTHLSEAIAYRKLDRTVGN